MPIPKQILVKLYNHQHQSMSEIASLLSCSLHKVNYWMSKYNLPRRSLSDANYHKYNPSGDPFQIKKSLTIGEQRLLSLSLGLFWGEGNKVNPEGVRLGNSDPNLIKIWCQFLRQICNVREDKIHFHLQIFHDNDPIVAKNYWAQHLSINQNRITSGTPTKKLGKGSYRKLNQHGVMTVGVYNTHFRVWIMAQLSKLGYNFDY
ncbi:MAG: hypothetical protein ABII80_00170 [bacterium]